ncbi:MAG: ATP-binding protein [Oscillospiraceae bacterium]|nr:ATP-binding protein [Oscillospiraceae bacterium]
MTGSENIKDISEPKIPRRILGALLNSVGAGVVPRFGLEYIAIGRKDEINAFTSDLDFISDGGSSFRFIIGRYGSGKSFLLQLVRNHCLERGFITADADLSPERRLSGTNKQGLAVYKELVSNLAARSSPDGNALMQIISRWLSELQTKIISEKKIALDSKELEIEMSAEILKISHSLENLVCGFDFASVILKYYIAYKNGEEDIKSAALRWLRGEYNTKTEARADLGVGTVIDDLNWYDFIKLLAVFVRKIGYKGLIVFIDECVNLYKITNKISRENNYEKILSMFNDTLQGKAEGLGIFMGGTPQFLEDNRRGLYSYEALKSRLTEGRFFSRDSKYKNLMGPVIRLERLSDDEIFALAMRIDILHRTYYEYEKKIGENNILEFLKVYMQRVGSASFITPREIIRDFLTVLDILYQNPEAGFDEILTKEEKKFTQSSQNPPDAAKEEEENREEQEETEAVKAFEVKFEDIEI